MLKNDKKL